MNTQLSIPPAPHRIELPATGLPLAPPPRSTAPSAKTPPLEAVWARHADEVEAAQRLRWRVFTQEMGARLSPPPGTPEGVDADLFDAHCEHLIVRTVETDDSPAEVVGTYRVLTPAAAKRLGGLYSDTEFDLVRLARLRPRLAELGRSCTAPAWRQGGVIMMLWSSLGSFMHRNGIEYITGCASVSVRDGGRQAADLWHTLRQFHLAPPDDQVRPRLPLPVDELATGRAAEPPALIKGYLKCGGKLLGPPAWDPAFGTADLPMMLRLADLPGSYRRRFVGN
ncbi:GNAT family N-acetyltransferase [Rubrivivax sp. A210]|uniref:GNAT family N-acetyltransferase n=1 Tax=Rubrivivax sp. A210 TaxID=2772301 RepID=UPI0019193E3D|nr:GNAT family N-acyltransferase [Rubrivivax sp. A210]